MGLKTTYYLRSLGASQVEKSTVTEIGSHIRDNNIKSNMANNAVNTNGANIIENATTIINNIAPSPSPIINTAMSEAVVSNKKYNIHKADNDAECEGCSA
ncbi:MAG: hypothetical protein QM532_00470 [Cyanobium sp. MAG06]|nr:hypothetical protein [Cyanobium sp. MAG06]